MTTITIPHDVWEDSLNGESSLADQLRRTTRREQTDIVLDKALGQVQQTGLVVDGEDSYVRASVEAIMTIDHITTVYILKKR